MDTASSPQIQETPHRMIQYVNRYRVGSALPPITYDQYLDLDGASDYLSTPDSANYTVSGDLELIVKAAADDWTLADSDVIFSHYTLSAGGRAWAVLNRSEVGGSIQLSGSDDGDSAAAAWSDSKPSVADAAAAWLRLRWNQSTKAVTIDEANVSGLPDVGDWSGMTVDGGGGTVNVTSLFDAASELAVGSYGGGGRQFAGRIYHAELRQGFDGPALARFNASQILGGVYQNISGETAWTINGSPVAGSD